MVNQKDQQRTMALNLVERVGLTGQEAALLMGLPRTSDPQAVGSHGRRRRHGSRRAVSEAGGTPTATSYCCGRTITAEDAPLAVYIHQAQRLPSEPQARGDSGEAVGRGAANPPSLAEP